MFLGERGGSPCGRGPRRRGPLARLEGFSSAPSPTARRPRDRFSPTISPDPPFEPWATTSLTQWIDTVLADTWGAKAASRTFHICTSGWDVDWPEPFAKGKRKDKPVSRTKRVPGQPEVASNLYEVSQALAWVSTSRVDREERTEWQGRIPKLLEDDTRNDPRR